MKRRSGKGTLAEKLYEEFRSSCSMPPICLDRFFMPGRIPENKYAQSDDWEVSHCYLFIHLCHFFHLFLSFFSFIHVFPFFMIVLQVPESLNQRKWMEIVRKFIAEETIHSDRNCSHYNQNSISKTRRILIFEGFLLFQMPNMLELCDKKVNLFIFFFF